MAMPDTARLSQAFGDLRRMRRDMKVAVLWSGERKICTVLRGDALNHSIFRTDDEGRVFHLCAEEIVNDDVTFEFDLDK